MVLPGIKTKTSGKTRRSWQDQDHQQDQVFWQDHDQPWYNPTASNCRKTSYHVKYMIKTWGLAVCSPQFNRFIAYNFNLQLPRSHPYFLSTLNFNLPFGLGHYCTIAEPETFLLAPPHIFLISPTAPRCRPLVKSQTDTSKFSPNRVQISSRVIAPANFFPRHGKVFKETIHWHWPRRSSSKNVFRQVKSQRAQGGGMRSQCGQQERTDPLYSWPRSRAGCSW